MILDPGGAAVDLGLQSRGSGAPRLRLNQSQVYSAGADSGDTSVHTVTWPNTETLINIILNEISAAQLISFTSFRQNVAVGAANTFPVFDDIDDSTWTARFTGEDINPVSLGIRIIKDAGMVETYSLNFGLLKY